MLNEWLNSSLTSLNMVLFHLNNFLILCQKRKKKFLLFVLRVIYECARGTPPSSHHKLDKKKNPFFYNKYFLNNEFIKYIKVDDSLIF